mgnify:FL=1
MTTWTYEGYRSTVLGAHATPDSLASEFDLDLSDRRGLDEWLGTAESEAWAVGGQPGAIPDEWAGFHAKALDELHAG